MVDKFWNFFRGSAARWRARGRTRRAGRTALARRPRSRSRPSAVHATCALVRRANDTSYEGPEAKAWASEIVTRVTKREPYEPNTNPVAERSLGVAKKS